jgi:hypothetical protein
MRLVPSLQPAAAHAAVPADHEAPAAHAAEVVAVAALIVTATAIVAARAVEVPSKADGSRTKITATVPGSRANRAGNRQLHCCPGAAARLFIKIKEAPWQRRNPRSKSAKKK